MISGTTNTSGESSASSVAAHSTALDSSMGVDSTGGRVTTADDTHRMAQAHANHYAMFAHVQANMVSFVILVCGMCSFSLVMKSVVFPLLALAVSVTIATIESRLLVRFFTSPGFLRFHDNLLARAITYLVFAIPLVLSAGTFTAAILLGVTVMTYILAWLCGEHASRGSSYGDDRYQLRNRMESALRRAARNRDIQLAGTTSELIASDTGGKPNTKPAHPARRNNH